MKFSLLRPAALLASLVLVVGLVATTAQAKTSHSLTGNARFQIGNGLPIPIGFSPVPIGKVIPSSNATVQQTLGPDPKALKAGAGAWQYGIPTPIAQNLGVFGANPALFQVMTNLVLSGPNNALPQNANGFYAGGRTGAATVTFCAGQTVPPNGNPGCSVPSQGVINGLMRYTKTANQFGGVSQGSVGGSANVALIVSTSATGQPGGAKCASGGPGCNAIFAFANPAGTGAQGASFGWMNSTPGSAPGTASGFAKVNSLTNGYITNIVSQPPVTGLTNMATEYGGPYTTGMVTVSVTDPVGMTPEIFKLTGADNRVNGVGTISLVAASVSNRTLSGPNGNRGWLNLTIGAGIPATPAIPAGGLAAIAGLLALAGGYVMRQRQNKA